MDRPGADSAVGFQAWQDCEDAGREAGDDCGRADQRLERLERLGFVSDLDRADISEFERGRRDPDLLTLLSYGRLAKVYLDVLVDDELDLPEDTSPCGPL